MGIARRPQFEHPPEGFHPAICIDSVDLGIVETKWGNKEQVKLIWELDVVDEETGEKKVRKDGLPYRISRKYTLSLDQRSTLFKHLESWRGRSFTMEELNGFDTENVVGKHCQIQVIHDQSPKDGQVYARVNGVSPLTRGLPKMDYPEGYTRVKDRDPESEPPEDPEDDSDRVPF